MLGFLDTQHLNSYKIDIFNIFIIRMLKIIFVLLFITFQSLAEDSGKQLPPCEGDYWAKCLDEDL